MIVGLKFSKNELIHVSFTSELQNFVAYCVFLAKHGFIQCCMTSIWPIIPALFLVLLTSYYSQNYAGILASPLVSIATFNATTCRWSASKNNCHFLLQYYVYSDNCADECLDGISGGCVAVVHVSLLLHNWIQ